MTWMTGSLFRRHLLLVAGLILLGQLANAVLFRQLVMKPRVSLGAQATAAQLLGLRDVLRGLPPEQARGAVDALNRHTLAATREHDVVERVLLARARQRLEADFLAQVTQRLADPDITVRWLDQDRDSVVATWRTAAGPHELVLASPLLARQFSRAWLLSSLATALLAMLGAWLIQRRIDRPLDDLVRAARQLGNGQRPAPLPEDGPAETAAVAQAFNHMATRLARTERERNLMLAGLSHDLRTPLAKMRLASEMLRRQPADSELLETLERNIGTVDRLLAQFLDYTRQAPGTDEPPRALLDCDLNEVVREAVLLCGESAGLTFTPGVLPTLALQPDTVQRLVLNLIVNAQRHGAPPVEVVTGCQGDQVWLEVRDRGAGIPPDQVAALKAPFARGNAARSDPADGAGLGLAIVERIAQAHGARLELLPRPGGGLVARVTGWRTAHDATARPHPASQT